MLCGAAAAIKWSHWANQNQSVVPETHGNVWDPRFYHCGNTVRELAFENFGGQFGKLKATRHFSPWVNQVNNIPQESLSAESCLCVCQCQSWRVIRMVVVVRRRHCRAQPYYGDQDAGNCWGPLLRQNPLGILVVVFWCGHCRYDNRRNRCWRKRQWPRTDSE